jgi:hypothetical protein
LTKKLDVVTTALRRPELLDITYSSFFSRLVGLPNVRIILNIDPLGNGDPDHCAHVARKYSDEVLIRMADKADFSAAVNWCFSNITSDYYLYLEDDWFLRREVNFRSWVESFDKADVDQSVLIMKKKRPAPDLNFSFRPHLARKHLLQKVKTIPKNTNPEKYLRDQFILSSEDFLSGGERLIEDTGRKWAKSNGLKKTDSSKSWFDSVGRSYLGRLEYNLRLFSWRRSLKS